jgi:hypothetical protein
MSEPEDEGEQTTVHSVNPMLAHTRQPSAVAEECAGSGMTREIDKVLDAIEHASTNEQRKELQETLQRLNEQHYAGGRHPNKQATELETTMKGGCCSQLVASIQCYGSGSSGSVSEHPLCSAQNLPKFFIEAELSEADNFETYKVAMVHGGRSLGLQVEEFAGMALVGPPAWSGRYPPLGINCHQLPFNRVVVSAIMEGTPAHQTGQIAEQDILIEIDGHGVLGVPFDTVLKYLKSEGKPNIEVVFLRKKCSPCNNSVTKRFIDYSAWCRWQTVVLRWIEGYAFDTYKVAIIRGDRGLGISLEELKFHHGAEEWVTDRENPAVQNYVWAPPLDRVVVGAIEEGKPAHQTGQIAEQDILIEIDGHDVRDISFDTVLKYLGREGKGKRNQELTMLQKQLKEAMETLVDFQMAGPDDDVTPYQVMEQDRLVAKLKFQVGDMESMCKPNIEMVFLRKKDGGSDGGSSGKELHTGGSDGVGSGNESHQTSRFVATKGLPRARCFRVKKVNDVEAISNLPTSMIADFNSDGLHFLDPACMSRKVLMSVGYADMYRWGGSSEGFSLIIGNADTQDTFEMNLATCQAAEMAALIQDFINAIMAEPEQERQQAMAAARQVSSDGGSSGNELHTWLGAVCGLKGRKLEAASAACNSHMVESVDELRALHAGGMISQVIPQVGIQILIEQAFHSEAAAGSNLPLPVAEVVADEVVSNRLHPYSSAAVV